VADNYDTLCCEITNTATGTPEACCNKILECHNPQAHDPKYVPPKDQGNYNLLNGCDNGYACAVSFF
jgi:hypothetical protein